MSYINKTSRRNLSMFRKLGHRVVRIKSDLHGYGVVIEYRMFIHSEPTITVKLSSGNTQEFRPCEVFLAYNPFAIWKFNRLQRKWWSIPKKHA